MLWQPTRGILQPNQHWRRGQGTAGGTTTFNPSDKEAGITLSNGNLTATNVTVNGSHCVRTIASASTGKLYCEFTLTTHASDLGETIACGFSNATQVLTNFLGQTVNGAGFWPRSTGGGATANIYFNNAATSLGTFTTGGQSGTVWAMALDLNQTPAKAWWKDVTHGGGWNNGVIGSQDPANNLGGFTNASLGARPYFLQIDIDTVVNDAWTLNVGATAYTGTPPSGYSNWP